MDTIKNYFVLLLSFVFICLNTGLTLNMHYCQGELESVTSVFQQSETCCAASDQNKTSIENHSCCVSVVDDHDNCCSNDVFFIKDTVEKINSSVLDTNFQKILQSYHNNRNIIHFKKQLNRVFKLFYSFQSNAPPLYNLYCRFVYFD